MWDRGGAPLHFVLAHAGFAVSGGWETLRWLSVAAALASVPVSFDLGRRLGGPPAGAVAAICRRDARPCSRSTAPSGGCTRCSSWPARSPRTCSCARSQLRTPRRRGARGGRGVAAAGRASLRRDSRGGRGRGRALALARPAAARRGAGGTRRPGAAAVRRRRPASVGPLRGRRRRASRRWRRPREAWRQFGRALQSFAGGGELLLVARLRRARPRRRVVACPGAASLRRLRRAGPARAAGAVHAAAHGGIARPVAAPSRVRAADLGRARRSRGRSPLRAAGLGRGGRRRASQRWSLRRAGSSTRATATSNAILGGGPGEVAPGDAGERRGGGRVGARERARRRRALPVLAGVPRRAARGGGRAVAPVRAGAAPPAHACGAPTGPCRESWSPCRWSAARSANRRVAARSRSYSSPRLVPRSGSPGRSPDERALLDGRVGGVRRRRSRRRPARLPPRRVPRAQPPRPARGPRLDPLASYTSAPKWQASESSWRFRPATRAAPPRCGGCASRG